MTQPRWQEIADLRAKGYRQVQIARLLGVTRQAVHDAVRRADDKGVVIETHIQFPESYISKAGKKSGSMGQLQRKLPTEVFKWLVDQTPEGAVVGDTIVAIIVDAYHEEIGNA